ncbi:MAG: hypothetical protein IPK12_02105 [Gemmatimonadetes bacterium]|nr:hypothetical protein [Gemmatimonadota bacterium]
MFLPRRVPLGLLAALVLVAGGCADDNDATGPSRRVTAGIRFVPLGWPADLTPDGSIAAIQDPLSGTGDLYFFHTATGVLEYKTQVGSPLRDFATGISATGVVTALYDDPVQAGFWTDRSEWTSLASAYQKGCDADFGGAWDVSADGRSVVGLVWHGCDAEAFRWDAAGRGIMTPLERLGASFPGSPSAPSNRATVIADDGSRVAGFAQTDQVDRWPAYWDADGSGTLLTGKPADQPGEVLAISADGRVLAGTWGGEAYYWSEAGGFVNLGLLPGGDPFFDPTYANAVSADGQLIFGTAGNAFFSVPRAWVWTAAGGLRDLTDVLTAAGLTLPAGTSLTGVVAASNDGTRVLGTATDAQFRTITFVLTLPQSAYGL